ncbi:MAG: hypothetical protein JWQ89_4393 [Devosia sp.]|uniref:hypothetical protein n=1 Tax=Devosia sp. TaxID=1871048 RepID=UPI002627CD1B|nr:hypothetical protein [Devosia sp.]MDB5542666.1 hypothetical protein [Devosia sp.]
MFRLPPSLKVVALAAALVLPAALPAVAGPAETALLGKYAGEWRGSGKVVGPDPGTVVCRMTFKTSSAGKLSYSGRCSFGGSGAASFRGTMLYNDARKRYEASSSAQGVSTTTIGKKQGSGIVFAANGMQTRYGNASSTMTLAGNAIKLNFKLVDKKGATTSSSITFGKN